jgi:tetratricopeptide (TPR) repeat protein
MLLKATMLLFLFFFFIWYAVWLNTHRHQIKGVFTSLLLLCLGVCAVLLPFAARNYAIDKRFSPFPIQGGLNFYRGNNPHATGTIMEIFSSMRAPIQEAREAAFWARRDAGKPLSDAEVSRYWAAKGASFIREQPWQYTQLLARKFLYFWNARESYASANYEFCQKYVPFLNLPFFSFGTITPFAIIGLFFALRGRSPYLMLIVLFVIASMISLMIFYVTARFRFPVVPYIIMLALHGARRIIAVLRKPDSQRQAYLYSLLMAAALFLSYNTVVSRTNQSENTMSYVNLGNSHARRGMYADARNAFRKALALNPRLARVHCMIGRTYFDERMFDTAVAEYAQALVIDPDSALAHVLMGEACHAQGLLDEAIAAYEKSLALDPDSAAAHADLGDAYLAGGRLRMAASEYEKAVDLDPAFLRKYYEIGNVFNSRGMTNEAIVFYQRYLEKEPRSPGVYTNLGNAYAKRGEMERAIQEYKRAIRLDPRWAEAHCSLGWVYYIIKMPDEALLELLIALETAPDAAIVHRNLAEVYRSLGDDEKATYHAKQERLLAEEQKVK